MFICIRQLSFGAFCKKIFHKNELQFLPESRALALKNSKSLRILYLLKKKSRAPDCTRLSARVRILLQNRTALTGKPLHTRKPAYGYLIANAKVYYRQQPLYAQLHG